MHSPKGSKATPLGGGLQVRTLPRTEENPGKVSLNFLKICGYSVGVGNYFLTVMDLRHERHASNITAEANPGRCGEHAGTHM